MIRQLDHVAIAVPNLDEAVPFYRDVLGLPFLYFEEVTDQKVRVACFDLGGMRLELLQPSSEDSPISKFLAQRGPGLHHLAFRSDDVASELERVRGHGVRLIDESPRSGAGGMQIAFLHPKSTQGVLMELTQPGEHVE
ncbi:MAG: methylmalonyl-CoA epimerase [Candidatus Eremiobacteraeota bacterium]|nr:methylmalonyl-CoA epimerase [Candidatus Eremiobacteraeota bacterium]MCW5866068.1 methylmalonyl-CoA epimerase [Candidatus Eremiobacteraeota bacterium]